MQFPSNPFEDLNMPDLEPKNKRKLRDEDRSLSSILRRVNNLKKIKMSKAQTEEAFTQRRQ